MTGKKTQTMPRKKTSLNNDAWDEVIAAFETDLYKRNHSEATIKNYRSCLNVFCCYYQEELKKPGPYVQRLQENDLTTFINFLRNDRKLSPSSINGHITVLKSFSTFIYKKKLQRRALASKLKTYRVQNHNNVNRLLKQEVRRLIASVDLNGRNGYRNLAILQLFLKCGLRVSELVRLCWDDITLKKTSGNIRVRDDNADTERSIPLNMTARKALQSYLDSQGPIDGHAPVFVSERQNRMSIAAVQHMVKRLLCHAGREDLSTHDLRHYFAYEFYAHTGNLATTQEVIGHTSINTTTRYAK